MLLIAYSSSEYSLDILQTALDCYIEISTLSTIELCPNTPNLVNLIFISSINISTYISTFANRYLSIHLPTNQFYLTLRDRRAAVSPVAEVAGVGREDVGARVDEVALVTF